MLERLRKKEKIKEKLEYLHETCKYKTLQYTNRVIYLSQKLKKGGKNILNILKKFRESMNLTQSAFAKSIGVSVSFYIKIELGIRKPSREFISKLKAKYPEFDVNNFF